MKRMFIILLTVLLAISMYACGKVTLHCDVCGKEIRANSNMDESWIVFCTDCEPELEE